MATLREIAEECGTTKQTVTSRLKEMGLWDGHVSKSGRTFEVDGFAASAVADSLKTAHRASESPTTVVDGKIAADVLNTAIEGLKTALSASQEQNAALAPGTRREKLPNRVPPRAGGLAAEDDRQALEPLVVRPGVRQGAAPGVDRVAPRDPHHLHDRREAPRARSAFPVGIGWPRPPVAPTG